MDSRFKDEDTKVEVRSSGKEREPACGEKAARGVVKEE